MNTPAATTPTTSAVADIIRRARTMRAGVGVALGPGPSGADIAAAIAAKR